MSAPQTITLTQPDDWHLHLRDGAAMASVLPASAAQFARAIVMPNLKPPVATTAQALAYRDRILAARPVGSTFEPLMTLYLTDNTAADEIRRAHGSGLIHAVKLYPAGATTHSDAGVTSMARVMPALEAMQAVGLPLLIHGEVVDPAVDTFDREAVFIERELVPLRRALPGLKVVFEHVTTHEAVQYVQSEHARQPSGAPLLGATITAHHLLYNRNALFTGGMRPHFYCLPVLKREQHRQALLAAATSGDARFFLGTDSAPHAARYKEHTAACAAGCYTAPAAMELYAEAFDAMGALGRLEGFASHHGADFYGLPRNTRRVTLTRAAWALPAHYAFGDSDATVVPLRAGETLPWTFSG
ncbi:MAG: dihydroorotase [Betaproteobacteria bacterium]|nr:dihydroorotase [Betaproteobacteria bacterium]MDE2048525.1 dihydroorotase [Betaproteobacteria bacterium]